MADPDITQEQLEAGTQVAQAANDAAERERTPDAARTAAKREMRRTAQKVNVEITDEQMEMIADLVVDRMEARGAFDPPPEPVTPPPRTPAQAEHQEPATTHEPPQRPQTFAERFRTK